MSNTPAALPRHPFPRCYRLTRTDDFSSVFGFRRAIRGTLFMLHYQPRPEGADDARLGLVVGKKFIKSAVRRNLVKRLARERFRLQHRRLAGYDLILRVLCKPSRLDRKEIAREVDGLFAKLRPRAIQASEGKVGE